MKFLFSSPIGSFRRLLAASASVTTLGLCVSACSMAPAGLMDDGPEQAPTLSVPSTNSITPQIQAERVCPPPPTLSACEEYQEKCGLFGWGYNLVAALGDLTNVPSQQGCFTNILKTLRENGTFKELLERFLRDDASGQVASILGMLWGTGADSLDLMGILDALGKLYDGLLTTIGCGNANVDLTDLIAGIFNAICQLISCVPSAHPVLAGVKLFCVGGNLVADVAKCLDLRTKCVNAEPTEEEEAEMYANIGCECAFVTAQACRSFQTTDGLTHLYVNPGIQGECELLALKKYSYQTPEHVLCTRACRHNTLRAALEACPPGDMWELGICRNLARGGDTVEQRPYLPTF